MEEHAIDQPHTTNMPSREILDKLNDSELIKRYCLDVDGMQHVTKSGRIHKKSPARRSQTFRLSYKPKIRN